MFYLEDVLIGMRRQKLVSVYLEEIINFFVFVNYKPYNVFKRSAWLSPVYHHNILFLRYPSKYHCINNVEFSIKFVK